MSEVTDAEAIVERLKAERAEKLKQAAKNGLPTRVVRTESKIIVPNFGKSIITGVLRTGVLRERAKAEDAKKAKAGTEEPKAGAGFTWKGEPGSEPPLDFSLRTAPFNQRLTPLEKAIIAFRALPVSYSYDLFRDRLLVGDHTLQQRIGESIDNAILVLRTAVIERFEFDPGAPLSRAAVIRLCLDNSFNPVLDYLTSLEWDGNPRLDTWLSRYVGAADEPLNRAFGRKVLIAAVRRVLVPGTKFDQVVVLEGPEGIGKSTLLKTLASPDYFCDEKIIGERSREVVELTTGVWIYELNELEGLGEESMPRVKALLSRTHGKARPAYGYVPVERGRTCIFFGTINGTKYLEGNTGNRRFWPVAAIKIDLEGIARDRDQLWAEAFRAEATGETLVLDEALWGVAAERAEERTARDPWEDAVSVAENLPAVPGQVWHGVNERGENEIRVRSEYIFATLLKLGPASANSSHWRRLAGVMKQLGWNEPKNMKIDGVSKATYSKKIIPVSPVPAPVSPASPSGSTLKTILEEKL